MVIIFQKPFKTVHQLERVGWGIAVYIKE